MMVVKCISCRKSQLMMRIHNRTCEPCLSKNIQQCKNNWAIDSLRNTLYRLRSHYQDPIYQYKDLFASIYHKGSHSFSNGGLK